MGFSETDGPPRAASRSSWGALQARGGRPQRVPDGRHRGRADEMPDPLATLVSDEEDGSERPRDKTLIKPVVREWLMDLQVMGRSQRTISWYEQKVNTFIRESGITSLEQLTVVEFKQYLAELRGRGLAPNTVHGYFGTLKAFANWAAREDYLVDHGLLRARAPKVPQQEMETYTEAQIGCGLLLALGADCPAVGRGSRADAARGDAGPHRRRRADVQLHSACDRLRPLSPWQGTGPAAARTTRSGGDAARPGRDQPGRRSRTIGGAGLLRPHGLLGPLADGEAAALVGSCGYRERSDWHQRLEELRRRRNDRRAGRLAPEAAQ